MEYRDKIIQRMREEEVKDMIIGEESYIEDEIEGRREEGKKGK